MQRRAFLWTPAMVSFVGGCSVSGMTPWHMWGTSEVVELNLTATQNLTESTQLAKINYGRPETWNFFLAGEVLGGDTPPVNVDIIVDFSVIVGIGRSHFNTQAAPVGAGPAEGFVRLAWRIPGGTAPGTTAFNRKYTTTTRSPQLEDAVGDPSRQEIDNFVAQDINCSATVFAAGDPGTYRIRLASFFAPMSHIRPEWFVEEFRGDEHRGN